MTRKCKCSGPCSPPTDGVTRREFITLVGLGAAGALMAPSERVRGAAPSASGAELTAWLHDLRQPGTPCVYLSDRHTDARLPLGGIGTGNIEIGPDGELRNWQLFNTLRDGYVPLFFAVSAGSVTRLLQTSGGGELPRVAEGRMIGQYPVADLNFHDPALPIQISLSAFSPFSPMDTAISSLPVVCFLFKVHNPTTQAQEVSVAALMQNPIGYEAIGEPLRHTSVEHPSVGANVNTISRDGMATVLSMSAVPSPRPTLPRPIHLFTNVNPDLLNAFRGERPEQFVIDDVQSLPEAALSLSNPEQAVIWLEEAPQDFQEQTLRHVQAAVTAGATLIFSGKTLPLVQEYRLAARQTSPAADVVYEDFEGGYDRWTVEGTAFGQRPAAGTLTGQQVVSGFEGKGLVNSFRGDTPTGKLISRDFTIEYDFIRFLIGGGDHPGTQIRLVIKGETVRTASGQNSEALLPMQWAVHEFRGQTAHLEIVDEETGDWGHILVDQILFSDLPFSSSRLASLRMLLGDMPGEMPQQWVHSAGQGKVIVHNETILEPAEAGLNEPRWKAYSTVAALVGVDYVVPKSTVETSPGYGTMALAMLGSNPTALTSFEDFSTALNQFAERGAFAPVTEAAPNAPTPAGRTINGALASSVKIAPSATVEVPFLLAWHYPNHYNSANQWIGNFYTQTWPDASAAVRHAATQLPTLREKTETFRRTFYDSTLPLWMLDCISSQISTIRHAGVVFRIANGDIYGWEGANGCCDPTCTHVWGYEQTLARLFPDLEREMRRIDLFHQQRPDGGINNRTDVPSPRHPSGQEPFTDGHASTILKAYREVLNSSDPALLHQYWPPVERAVNYLIARDAASSGGLPTGTLSDGQENTYDNTIHGVNTFIGTYYLAALRAGEEMARRVGDQDTAHRFHAVFEQGRQNLNAQCWNGEYYQQNLPDYAARAGEYGPGCLSDQLLGQWWAHQLDLGYVLPKEHVRSALQAIYRHNWRTDFTHFQHNWRRFAGGTDKGLLLCSWPKGGRPANTIPYVDEVWTGVEYQVAGHMLYEGMVEEAFAIVKGARERYDGIPRPPIPRNPWSEIECGGHYARAMSSWSLLLALSGFHYDGLTQTLRFQPLANPAIFKSFFTAPEGWGSVSQTQHGAAWQTEVRILSGHVAVKQLRLAAASAPFKAKAMLGHQIVTGRLTHSSDGIMLSFPYPLLVKVDHPLTVYLS